jgi:hypothetical protein
MAKNAVIRTDLMHGTKNGDQLVSLRFYGADGKVAEVENGVIVELKGFEDGQREVMKAVAATADSNMADCAIIAAPEVMYDERKKNLDEFINEAGKAIRGYRLVDRNMFALTAEVSSAAPPLPRMARLALAPMASWMPLAPALASVSISRLLAATPTTPLRSPALNG